MTTCKKIELFFVESSQGLASISDFIDVHKEFRIFLLGGAVNLSIPEFYNCLEKDVYRFESISKYDCFSLQAELRSYEITLYLTDETFNGVSAFIVNYFEKYINKINLITHISNRSYSALAQWLNPYYKFKVCAYIVYSEVKNMRFPCISFLIFLLKNIKPIQFDNGAYGYYIDLDYSSIFEYKPNLGMVNRKPLSVAKNIIVLLPLLRNSAQKLFFKEVLYEVGALTDKNSNLLNMISVKLHPRSRTSEESLLNSLLPNIASIDKFTPLECMDLSTSIVVSLRTTAFSNDVVRFYSLASEYGLNSPTDKKLGKESITMHRLFNKVLPLLNNYAE